jgi:hypothetical protein
MSQSELHFGKLKKVEMKEPQTLEDFYQEKLKEKGITEFNPAHDDWEEAFLDEYWEKYIVVNNNVFEIYDHEERDDSDDIYDIKPNGDGTYSFIMKFYNGGTYLTECLEEELSKVLSKDEF